MLELASPAPLPAGRLRLLEPDGSSASVLLTRLTNGSYDKPFIQDCGVGCTGANFAHGFYYTCATAATCQAAAVPLAQQVSNPVNFFTVNLNLMFGMGGPQ